MSVMGNPNLFSILGILNKLMPGHGGERPRGLGAEGRSELHVEVGWTLQEQGRRQRERGDGRTGSQEEDDKMRTGTRTGISGSEETRARLTLRPEDSSG